MASSLPQRLPGLLVVSLFFALVTDALVLPASLSCRQPTRFTATSVTGTRPQASTLSLSSSSSFSFSFPTALYPSSLNCKSSSHSLTSLRAIEIVDGTTGQDEEDDTPAPTGTFAWFKKWWQKTAKIDRKKLAGTSSSSPALLPSLPLFLVQFPSSKPTMNMYLFYSRPTNVSSFPFTRLSLQPSAPVPFVHTA